MPHAASLALPFLTPDVVHPDAEPDLVRRAQQRDAAAFASLYRAHVGRVYALCLRMTADVPFAEELTQQAFIGAWDKLPLFRGESAFGSWLHRLAVNTVLMALRARARLAARVFFTDDPAAHESTPTASPTRPELVAQAGTRLDLEQAIAALPPQARTVFVLHDVEGWQHHEIAERLGVATGTSKAQLHRARQLLQDALR